MNNDKAARAKTLFALFGISIILFGTICYGRFVSLNMCIALLASSYLYVLSVVMPSTYAVLEISVGIVGLWVVANKGMGNLVIDSSGDLAPRWQATSVLFVGAVYVAVKGLTDLQKSNLGLKLLRRLHERLSQTPRI